MAAALMEKGEKRFIYKEALEDQDYVIVWILTQWVSNCMFQHHELLSKPSTEVIGLPSKALTFFNTPVNFEEGANALAGFGVFQPSGNIGLRGGDPDVLHQMGALT